MLALKYFSVVADQSAVHRICQKPLYGHFCQRLILPFSGKPDRGSQLDNIVQGVFPSGIGFEQLLDLRGRYRINFNFLGLEIVIVAKQGHPRPFAPAKFLTQTALNVFGQIINVVFGLAENDVQHKLTLGRVIKAIGREIQVVDQAFIDQVDNFAAVNGVTGQPVRMPGNNAFCFAFFYSGYHFVEYRPAWLLGGPGFSKFLDDDRVCIFSGKVPQFSQLGFNR
ncbi:MAG: hypothetical protein WC838_02675 [Candidatus Margulisiibacteriota bacterium]